MKRWEFTGETKTVSGVTLRRIKAAVTFTLKCGITVKAGKVGGWIEKESNLADDAWVADDACVTGNARVTGNACVTGNARVTDDAWVTGNARVADDARVTGNARVIGNARVAGNAHYLLIGRIGSRADFTTFTRDKAGTIYVSCGCFYGTLDEFRAKVRETHGDSKHGRVYQAAADLAELQIDTTPIEKGEGNEEGNAR